jgi:hypothetical protein
VERVPRKLLLRFVSLVVLATPMAGCRQQAEVWRQHEQKFASLAATTTLISQAWLSGEVSATFASTALEQTLLLTEKERNSFASRSQSISDPDGARLSQVGEELSRRIGGLAHDVAASDAAGVRRRLQGPAITPVSTR